MNVHANSEFSISSNFKIKEVDYDRGRVVVEDIPTNPVTGKPYFEIKKWGDIDWPDNVNTYHYETKKPTE